MTFLDVPHVRTKCEITMLCCFQNMFRGIDGPCLSQRKPEAITQKSRPGLAESLSASSDVSMLEQLEPTTAYKIWTNFEISSFKSSFYSERYAKRHVFLTCAPTFNLTENGAGQCRSKRSRSSGWLSVAEKHRSFPASMSNCWVLISSTPVLCVQSLVARIPFDSTSWSPVSCKRLATADEHLESGRK